ncbi:MAG: Hsp20/alpha crystallin family protein [Candidatus Kerfeldbacteria bacterium]|nr:Hsp20/alpha crystallin family protein [Candidatus Kerfeldbacteria bacterium]
MRMIKWHPMRPWFDDEFGPPMFSGDRDFAPALDVYEDEHHVIVETPLAGVDPNKVTIEIEDNVLTFSGSTERTSEVDDKHYYRREVRSGSFYRSVALPKAVKGDAAEATFDKGVLKITVPKAEEAKPKKIAVTVKKS